MSGERRQTLDDWAARRMGLDGPPTRAMIDAYKLARICDTIAWARQRSPFYRNVADWPEKPPATLADLARLPFTAAADLAGALPPLAALPLREAARLVTLPTSGTAGPPKRIAFTADDIEATTDYFHHGMATLVGPGERVAVAFPATTPASVGALLVAGLRRLGADAIPVPAERVETLVAALREIAPTAIAGMPVTLGAAARHGAADGGPPLVIRTALVSADRAAPSLVAALAALWGCEVFDHWGMTETGYGGALACRTHDGLHIRETDIHLEVVDRAGRTPLPDGAEGEIVLTTLRRRGLPLLRYLTGDVGAIDTRPCCCGSSLARLRLRGRATVGAALADGTLGIELLDDIVFAVDGVVDFTAALDAGRPPVLRIGVVAARPDAVAVVHAALAAADPIAAALFGGALALDVAAGPDPPPPIHRKRRLLGAVDEPPETAVFRQISSAI